MACVVPSRQLRFESYNLAGLLLLYPLGVLHWRQHLLLLATVNHIVSSIRGILDFIMHCVGW